MISVLGILIIVCVICFIQWCYKRSEVIKHLEKFNGPPPLPILGNSLDFLSITVILPTVMKYSEKYGSVVKIWIGPTPSMLIIRDYKFVEFILTSTKTSSKSPEYRYLYDWLGLGLITNNGDARWAKHRKILTSAFYYNVLEKFLPVFSSVSDVLVMKLEKEVGNPSFDINNLMKLYTLDTICECAMGTPVNALENSNSEFVKAVETVCDIFTQRTFNVFLKPDLLFRFSKHYHITKAAFQLLNDTVRTVISKRKTRRVILNNDSTNSEDEYGKRKRLAFLDLLLDKAANDPELTDELIREEVGTIMFAGHDTIQASLSFALYSLAEHQDIQEKVFNELRELFGNDRNISITLADMKGMKYMEAVIKETIRLYPPVPFFARTASEDLNYDQHVIPKGTTLLINVIGLHRDPDLYPDPLRFDPDRFITGEAPKHPYAYLPFSAGLRECMGKRFTMIEMKLTMAKLLWKFKFLPSNPKQELELTNEIVLTSRGGIRLQMENRNF